MKFWSARRNVRLVQTAWEGEQAAALPDHMECVRITDGLLRELELRLASRPPERGGVILGTGSLLHTFIEDDHGNYSGGHWDVSDEVVATCNELQQKRFGIYAGQVHSHPAGIADPSGPDRTLMMGALATNPARNFLVVPILTEGAPREHDVAVGARHRLSMMIAVRSSNGPEMQRARVAVVPLLRDLEAAGLDADFGTSTSEAASERRGFGREITISGETYIGFAHSGGRKGYVLIHPSYPDEPPIALQPSPDGGASVIKAASWKGGESLHELAEFVRSTAPSPDLEVRNAKRAIAGSTDRIEPLVGSLGGSHALIAGLGSVGSRIAEDLCRSGVGSFTLIDPDVVEPANLGRSVYVASDLGSRKVEALAHRLQSINPGARVTSFAHELGQTADLATLVDTADIVIGATDDMEQQELLSHHAYSALKPMVSCALYRRAAAGEVIFSLPAANTPCIFCSLADLDNAMRPEKNYGAGGRLVAEPALGPSIQLVASYASILALAILGGPSTEAGRSLIPLVRTGRTYGKISTTPDWDFFPKLFNEMGHQHAPQSVWIQAQRRNGCYACGEERRPPVDKASGAELATYLLNERASSSPNPAV